MSSNINPNNIDGAYPVAGQDNNSQGFRDNFTNTKTNFQYAANEITELQNKVVLKSALTGTTLDNNMLGSVLSNAQLQDMSQTSVSLGTIGGSVAIDYSAGSYQTITPNASVSLSFANWPVAGAAGAVVVRLTITNISYTLTMPVYVGAGASARSVYGIEGIAYNGGDPISAPGSYTGSTITFAETGTYELLFQTDDAGATVYLAELTRPRNRFTNGITVTSGAVIAAGAEDLASGAAANLSLTASYFSTAAAETATLAAGTNGQIKTFAMYADSGDMVITVTNAGWKTSGTGTITFDAIGDSCTLQYINSKWFCIGNNGCVFA